MNSDFERLLNPYNKVCPVPLYKYHNVKDENLVHLMQLIANHEFYFSKWRTLDDVYDFRIELADSLILKYFNNNEDSPIDHLSIGFKKVYDQIWESVDDFWRVCCFTEDWRNEVMWPFYANNYNGVCLEFDFTKSPFIYQNLYPVDFTNNDGVMIIEKDGDFAKAALTKGHRWAFLEEWRMVMNEEKFNFPKEALTAIHFGFRTRKDVISEIVELCIANDYDWLKFYFVEINNKILKRIPLNIKIKPLS